MHTEYMFSFICSEQCINIISLRKKCGLFGSVFKKIIPKITLPLLFKKWMGKYSLTFCRWHIYFSWVRVNRHRIEIDFYSQGIFSVLFATVFN